MRLATQLGICCLLASGGFAAGRSAAGHGGGHAPGHAGVRAGLRSRAYGNQGFRSGYLYGPGYWDSGYPDYSGYLGSANEGNEYPPFAPMYGPPPLPAYPAPAPPAHLFIQEYPAAADRGFSPPQEDNSPAYSIAFKDGATRTVTMFWVDGVTLHYLDTDHHERRAPLASVDRNLSARLNRERHVPFDLP
jgi:hypothetical protein